MLTGFDPIATFQSISRVQAKDLIPLMRPFPQHLVFDVIDFGLGSGYVSYLLVAFFLIARGRSIVFSREPANRLTQISLLQILIVAGAALLPGETARLWMLLLPLLMAPIGREFSTWTARQRMIAYACVFVLAVVICQNMNFIYMGPELDGPRAR